MNAHPFRTLPAVAAIAAALAFGGHALAQTSPTSSAPVPTKDALDPANKTVEASTPKSAEARDGKVMTKAERKSAKRNTKAGKKAARASDSYNPSLANGNAGDPGRPAQSTR
ncbi:MAG: hypothetical protein EON92_11470 [Burkholderiales bacterium]|nr:MAG: hypothetical protein EON92_11470 [Burkholderiales bacterium]